MEIQEGKLRQIRERENNSRFDFNLPVWNSRFSFSGWSKSAKLFIVNDILCAVIFPTLLPGLTVVDNLPAFFVFNLLLELLLLIIDFAAVGLLTVLPYFIELDVEDNVDGNVVVTAVAAVGTAVAVVVAAVTVATSSELAGALTILVVVVVVVVVIVAVVVSATFVPVVAVVVIGEAADVSLVEFSFVAPLTVDGVFVVSLIIFCVMDIVILLVGEVVLTLETLASGTGRLVLVGVRNWPRCSFVLSRGRNSIAADLLITSVNSNFVVTMSLAILSVSSSGAKVTKGWGVMKPVRMLRFTFGFMKLDTTRRSRWVTSQSRSVRHIVSGK